MFYFESEKNWPPEGKSKRYEVNRDTGISSVGRERKGNTGGAWKLKLKGQQEFILIDIDADVFGLASSREACQPSRLSGEQI